MNYYEYQNIGGSNLDRYVEVSPAYKIDDKCILSFKTEFQNDNEMIEMNNII